VALDDEGPRHPEPGVGHKAAGLLYIGTLNAACVVGGLLLGRWLDQAARTAALFTFLGVALGIVCGGAGTVALVRSYLRG